MPLLTDLRYSTRSLARTPGFAVALLFSIAVGIGSNAVVYGFGRGLIESTLAAESDYGAVDITPETVDALSQVTLLLRAAAAAVFFIACANVAAFLVARAAARSRETSVRVALGASRPQLAMQLLSDSIVISAAGGATGLLLTHWTANIIPVLFFSADAEQLAFTPDVAAIGASTVVGCAITIACGLLPLLQMRHDRPAVVLQRESAGPSVGAHRLRTGLVIAQMACCSLLVISAGLLLQSFRSSMQTGVGRQLGEPILATLQVRPDSSSRAETRSIGLKYYGEAERAAQSMAGISSTAWVAALPGGAPAMQSFRIEPPVTQSRDVTMTVTSFTPAVLPQIFLPPLAGRLFGGEDTAGACRVVVIDQQAAIEQFNGDAVGRAMEDHEGRGVEIVGVVGLRRLTDGAPAATVFVYPDQTGGAADLKGRAQFRIPDASLTTAMLESHVVSRSFFDMLESKPTAGTLFHDDLDADACGVAVVNQDAADDYFGGNAVGGAVIDAAGRRSEIVGVVQSPRLLKFERRVEPAIYFPMAQNFLPRMALLLRTPHPDRTTIGAIHRTLDRVKGAFRPPYVVTLSEHINQTALAPLRIATTLITASAIMALGLGVLGLYSAMAESVRQRRRETAVRIALGSQRWRVRRAVLADGVRLAGVGAVAGMAGALAVSRLLTQVSPAGGSPTAWAWLAAPLVLLATVVIAGLLPARRAVLVDPLKALSRD